MFCTGQLIFFFLDLCLRIRVVIVLGLFPHTFLMVDLFLKIICSLQLKLRLFGGFPDSSVGKESVCNAGNPGLIPGLGKSTGERIERKSQEHLLY